MSVYNGERFLRESVDSILNQTYKNFECIIINDGSTDNTWNILKEYQDSRIRLIRNKKNIGLTKSLNKAIAVSKGTYIARMDADDINYPERFEKQVDFLDQHQDIDVLGTNLVMIDARGNILKDQPEPFPTRPEVIRWMIYVRNCIQHPTVMFRRNVYNETGGYDSNLKYTQDYDLWMRASLRFNLCNLPDVLLAYRCHSENVSNRHKKKQRKAAEETVLKNLSVFLKQEINHNLYNRIETCKRYSDNELATGIATLFNVLSQKYFSDPDLSFDNKILIQRTLIHRLLILADRHKKNPMVALKYFGKALTIDKDWTFRILLNKKGLQRFRLVERI